MLALLCFCVAAEFSVNKDLYISYSGRRQQLQKYAAHFILYAHFGRVSATGYRFCHRADIASPSGPDCRPPLQYAVPILTGPMQDGRPRQNLRRSPDARWKLAAGAPSVRPLILRTSHGADRTISISSRACGFATRQILATIFHDISAAAATGPGLSRPRVSGGIIRPAALGRGASGRAPRTRLGVGRPPSSPGEHLFSRRPVGIWPSPAAISG